jgi:enterochelin esterase family protein
MGGLESLTVGLNHTDLFAWVGGFSAAVQEEQPSAYAALDPKKANLKLLYISVGLNEQLLAADRRFAATLRSRGFHVTTVETPGNGHVWQQWRGDLVTFATTIFQGK